MSVRSPGIMNMNVQHRTSNAERRTSPTPFDVERSMFDVRCSKFVFFKGGHIG